MKKIVFITISFIICTIAHSQRLSIDIMPGLMNYGGDLQPSSLTFNQACLAIEGGLQYKLTDNLYIRGDYLAGQVKADDKLSKKSYALQRNLNFKSIILEGSFSLEYDFFKLRVDKKWTPYVFAGVGYFFFNPYTHDTAGNKFYLQPYGTEGQGLAQYPDRKFYSLYQFNIPAGFGLKYALNDKVSIGFEVGFRKLFTDYLDDVSTTYPNADALNAARGPIAVELSFRGGEVNPNAAYREGNPRGNPGSKDEYYTGLFRLTYTLGGNRGGGEGFSSFDRKSLRCPKPVL
ncbi:MAG TPA: DUF6089 family protein [Chitinophagaceae bacterium]|nr:DUF6089 family protein [Chitinophagaceae bacterium]